MLVEEYAIHPMTKKKLSVKDDEKDNDNENRELNRKRSLITS